MTWNRDGIISVVAILLTVFVWTCRMASADAKLPADSGSTPSGDVIVLSSDSYVRELSAFRTPVLISKDGQIQACAEPVAKNPKPIPQFESPVPPTDWIRPDFDDSAWNRRRCPVEIDPPPLPHPGPMLFPVNSAIANSQICLRSKFAIEDIASVHNLRLSLEYVGGVVVYINGRELTRANLPTGELKPDTLAEKYPDDLYCLPEGMFLQDITKHTEGFNRRYRKLDNVAVPSNLLLKGTNVLAVEIRRAPVNEAALQAKRTPVGGMYVVPSMWAYAGLKNLSLVVAAGSSAMPNLTRPKGVQVWNCAPFDTIDAFAYGEGGTILPVTVASPRNGVVSGRLIVSSDQTIKGLKVTVTDLTQADGGGKLAASAIRVRCAVPATPADSWVPSERFDGLFDSIPAEIPVVKANPPRELYVRGVSEGLKIVRNNQSPGALAPLWITVRVPKDAKPGTYAGAINVSAEGLSPTSVPLHLVVSNWCIRDPKDWMVHNFAYLSEDAVAKHYGVSLWSEKHLELVGKSMALMAETNSRQVIVNMAINFYGGNKGDPNVSNEQSMVRWIRQADGSYKYDFSIFDKYMDMVAQVIGKPTLLRINCWGEAAKQDGKLVHKGAVTTVSRLDPATGNIEPMDQPIPGTEESFTFWKPVLDELRKKVEARGWWDVTAMGHNSYCTLPIPEVVSIYKRIWPDGVWSYTAHNGTMGMRMQTTDKAVTMPVMQADTVWNLHALDPRGYRAMLQPRPTYWCFTWRTEMRDDSDLTLLRRVPEDEIMRGHDGVSDFAADLFPVKGPNGRYYCLGNGRGTGGPSCSTQAMLAPGPDGAVSTERFEMLREGAQLAEAILFVEKALQDKKLNDDLAQRANRCLDDRAEAYLKCWSAGRFERDLRLLALAGEVDAVIHGDK